MKKVLLAVCFLTLCGCTDNIRAKHYGGHSKENLPAGFKLVNVTWKKDNMWVLMRPAKEYESPETYQFKEFSNFGVFQGAVTIVESR